MTDGRVVPPGATIGILGGGQLGRMTALAAAPLGYRTCVLTPETDAPASFVTDRTILAGYEDPEALAAFAAVVDVVTIEFENVPAATLERLAAQVPVRPSAAVLRITQDRLAEKDFVVSAGGATAPYRAVDDPGELRAALQEIGTPAVLKTRRMGYDGKGQALIESVGSADEAFAAIGGGPAILEGFVRFDRELSVIVARAPDGSVAVYDPVENRHENHILRETIAPAPILAPVAEAARALGVRLAEALGVEGLLAVELFLGIDGALLVNEMAPRPHNSGHWTIDACDVSQFEQLVRAACGLPLGPTARRADARMRNLLGDEVSGWQDLLADPAARFHDYGKRDPRPGRKMGHVTWLSPRSDA